MEKEEIILRRDELREKLEKENQDIKVGKIVYYKDFEVIKGDKNHSPFYENNLFVVTRKKEEEGKELEYYELYDRDQNLIGTTNEKGELKYSEEYKERLGVIYKSLDLDNRKMYLQRENEFTVLDKPIEELSLEEKIKNEEKEEIYKENKFDKVEPVLIEEDLKMEKDSISYCDEIKDKSFYDMVPESAEFSRKAMLVYSEKTNEFMIVGLKNGKFEKYDSIIPAQSIMKTSQDLDQEGNHIESKSINGLLQFKNKNDIDFSVKVDQTGDVKLQQLRKDPETGKIIASNLETDSQYKANWKVKEMMNEKEDISEDVKIIDNKENTEVVKIEKVFQNEQEQEKFEGQLKDTNGVLIDDWNKEMEKNEKHFIEIDDDEEKEKVPWDTLPNRRNRS